MPRPPRRPRLGTLRVWTFGLLTFCLASTACDLLPRPGDTRGVQQQAIWVKQGRLTVDTDRKVTLVRLRADSTTGDHDVLLTRFDFAPSGAEGAEYALRLGLDLGHARELSIGHAYRLGSEIPAFGTVTCFCRPLRPDSVRGTYVLQQRGVAQLTGRVDATLYFTAWDSSADHVTYRLRQSIFGVR